LLFSPTTIEVKGLCTNGIFSINGAGLAFNTNKKGTALPKAIVCTSCIQLRKLYNAAPIRFAQSVARANSAVGQAKYTEIFARKE
jgi:hypothetical protein